MTESQELSQLIGDVREQVLYLQELGVETLGVTLAERSVESRALRVESPRTVPRESQMQRPSPASIPEIKIPASKPAEPRVPGQSRLASLPSLSKLNTSVPVRSPEPVKPPETNETTIVELKNEILLQVAPARTDPIETIEQIRAEIGPDCTRCKLSTLGRSKVVNSTGNFNAELMFVGEAPGADEDEQGFPFVGRAGKLLTDIMMAIGFSRDDVFIGNINRCRPPGNRAPEPDETVACKPFLQREIAVVRPKVIVVLGATAARNLLATKVPIGKLRGNFHDYLGTKVMPTFHPAYLLRDPHKKREVWEDMKMVRDYLKAV